MFYDLHLVTPVYGYKWVEQTQVFKVCGFSIFSFTFVFTVSTKQVQKNRNHRRPYKFGLTVCVCVCINIIITHITQNTTTPPKLPSG